MSPLCLARGKEEVVYPLHHHNTTHIVLDIITLISIRGCAAQRGSVSSRSHTAGSGGPASVLHLPPRLSLASGSLRVSVQPLPRSHEDGGLPVPQPPYREMTGLGPLPFAPELTVSLWQILPASRLVAPPPNPEPQKHPWKSPGSTLPFYRGARRGPRKGAAG